MSSISKADYAQNVANLQKITQQVTNYALYNPPVDNITIPNLHKLYTTAYAKLCELEEKRTINKNAINTRQTAFENLKPICTKIVNILYGLRLTEGIINEARALNRSIHGSKKKSKILSADDKETVKTTLTSTQPFTQQAEDFKIIMQLLTNLSNYNPTEEQLKLSSLNTYYTSLLTAICSVDQSETEYNNKLMEIEKIVYTEETGLYVISENIKEYVKSLYGSTSTEYIKVSAIGFTSRAYEFS